MNKNKKKCKKNCLFNKFSRILTYFMALYIALPIIFLILFSFSQRLEIIPKSFTFKWYLFNMETIFVAMGNTLKISIPATFAGVLVALPLAYAVARLDFKVRNLVNQLIILPAIIPGAVLGLAFLQMKNSAILSNIFSSYVILIIAHIVVIIPAISRPIIGALEQNAALPEEAANTLGGKPLYVFRTITFPIIAPSVLVGMIFGFARSITDFVMTLFIVPAGMVPMSIQIYNSTTFSTQQVSAANATILLIFVLISVSIANKIIKKNNSINTN